MSACAQRVSSHPSLASAFAAEAVLQGCPTLDARRGCPFQPAPVNAAREWLLGGIARSVAQALRADSPDKERGCLPRGISSLQRSSLHHPQPQPSVPRRLTNSNNGQALVAEDTVVRHEASTPIRSTVTETLGEGESASAEGCEVRLAVGVSSKDSAPAPGKGEGQDLSQRRRELVRSYILTESRRRSCKEEGAGSSCGELASVKALGWA